MVSSLFEDCVTVVLKSVNLLKKASINLPKIICHYLLHEACTARNYTAIEVIVRSWPHSELSFDFMSNHFCRRKKEQSRRCLFNKIYACLLGNRDPFLEMIDLSMIRIDELSKVDIIFKLIEGEFPVKHSSEYVISADKKTFPLSKPRFPRCTCSSRRMTIKLNVMILSQEMLDKLHSGNDNFNVEYSGIDFTSPYLRKKVLQKNSDEFSPCLLPKGTLWLDCRSSFRSYSIVFSKYKSSVPLRVVITQLCGDLLNTLVDLNISVYAFSILPLTPSISRIMVNSTDSLLRFLFANSNVLEYLQLRYFVTTPTLEYIQKCNHLRVLSLIMDNSTLMVNSHTAVELFEALQHIKALEYFEWSSSLNLTTSDLFALNRLLLNHLPRLVHFHLRFSYLLLFTTDLSNSYFKPLYDLLIQLLKDKIQHSWCCTYKFTTDNTHFQKWLGERRPEICFNCTSEIYKSSLHFKTMIS